MELGHAEEFSRAMKVYYQHSGAPTFNLTFKLTVGSLKMCLAACSCLFGLCRSEISQHNDFSD